LTHSKSSEFILLLGLFLCISSRPFPVPKKIRCQFNISMNFFVLRSSRRRSILSSISIALCPKAGAKIKPFFILTIVFKPFFEKRFKGLYFYELPVFCGIYSRSKRLQIYIQLLIKQVFSFPKQQKKFSQNLTD